MAAAQVELPFERQLYLQAERLLMAGSSQGGVQVGCRKPATQADWGWSRHLNSKCNHDRRLVAVMDSYP